MQKNQKINCNVESCRHNNHCGNCILDSITVVNNAAQPTAHYCYDYLADVFE